MLNLTIHLKIKNGFIELKTNFDRIERLPPYVFNIVGELKMAARHCDEGIVDLGWGIPVCLRLSIL